MFFCIKSLICSLYVALTHTSVHSRHISVLRVPVAALLYNVYCTYMYLLTSWILLCINYLIIKLNSVLSPYTCSSHLPGLLPALSIWARHLCTILTQSPSQDFTHMPAFGRSPTNVSVDMKGSKSLSFIITWLPSHFRFRMSSCFISPSATSHPIHPFPPLLSMWYVDTDLIVCHFPSLPWISGFKPNHGLGFNEASKYCAVPFPTRTYFQGCRSQSLLWRRWALSSLLPVALSLIQMLFALMPLTCLLRFSLPCITQNN